MPTLVKCCSLAPICSLFDSPSSRPHHLAECPSFSLPLFLPTTYGLIPFSQVPTEQLEQSSHNTTGPSTSLLPKPTPCPLTPLPWAPVFGPKPAFHLSPLLSLKPGPVEVGRSRLG